jgi:S1-C subfamily serine protease
MYHPFHRVQGEPRPTMDPTPETTEAPTPSSASRNRILIPAAVGLAAGLIGGGIVLGVHDATSSSPSTSASASATTTTPSGSTTIIAGSAPNWVGVAARSMPGVVEISTEQTAANPLGGSGKTAALGTGFVIDAKGDILTNEHVVGNSSTINVQFPNGTSTSAKLVGSDPSSDLAVIHVNLAASQLHPLPLGNAATIKVGQPVLAIGTPFGYSESASAGIVSGLGREIQSPNGFTLANAIQTDAAVNHGNSGGPLLDQSGHVIGVNAQIADSGVDANVGVAFAVPMAPTELSIIHQLLAKGSVSHPWLGITGISATAQLHQNGVTPVSSGVLVTGVAKGSPAATAGIIGGTHAKTVLGTCVPVGGDTITQMGGSAIRSMTDLQVFLAGQPVGSTVQATIVHTNGSTGTVSITLTKQPTTAPTITSVCSTTTG